MKKVYIISTCTRKNKYYSEFHFKGFFKGERIVLIRIISNQFSVGDEYLIKMVNFNIEKNILIGSAEKFKKLS